MGGPLTGLKVIELAGMGPGPFCAMLLADLGATVLRIDRPAVPGKEVGIAKPLKYCPEYRNRYTVTLDLKNSKDVEVLLELLDDADGFIDVNRPGVAERLGFGPDTGLERNPRLTYGRMTGWGQSGPLASRVGHDLNYISLSGVLEATGRRGQPPSIPLHLVGDYAGAVYLAFGMVSAMLEVARGGGGQVVDAAISDSTVSLASVIYGYRQFGWWNLERGTNIVDSGCPYYDIYECNDGRYMAFAPIEERFYRTALEALGLDPAQVPDRDDEANWDSLRDVIAKAFRQRSMNEWAELFFEKDACVTPVLNIDEAIKDPHLTARQAFVTVAGAVSAAPAPRFSGSMVPQPEPARIADRSTIEAALEGWLPPERVAEYVSEGFFVPG